MFKYGNPTIQNTQYYLSRNTTYRQLDNISVAIDPEQLLSSIIDNNLLTSALGDDIETQKITTNETETNILNVNEIKGNDDSIIKFLNDTHFTRRVLFAPANETFLSTSSSASGNNFFRVHIKGSTSDDVSSNRADVLIENKFTYINSERLRISSSKNYDNFSKNLNYGSNIIKFNRSRFNYLDQPQSSLNFFQNNTFGIFCRKTDSPVENMNDMGIFISPKFNRSNITIPNPNPPGPDIITGYNYSIIDTFDVRLGNNAPFTTKPSIKFVNLNFNYNNDIKLTDLTQPFPDETNKFRDFIDNVSDNKYVEDLYLPLEVDRINIHSGNIINPNQTREITIQILRPGDDSNYLKIFEYLNGVISTKSNQFNINDLNGVNIIQTNNITKDISFNSLNNFFVNSDTININTNNLLITDPIIKISHNNFNNTDKGIEFNYNPNKLGFFGLDKDNKAYKFLINAINTNNDVSGDYAEIELAQITNPVSDLSINSFGNITLNPNNNKDVIINSDLDLLGNFLKNANINVSNIKSDFNIILDPSNTLIVEGDLEVSGNTIINYNLNVIGDASFNRNLEISGNTLIKSNLNISGNLIVDNNSKFNSNLDISQNLNVSGSLIVFNNSNFNSNLNISGSLLVDNNTIIKSNLDVYENINAFGDLIIDGSVTFKSSINFLGDVSLNSNLEVSGNILGKSRLDIFGDASFNQDVEISGNLKVNGAIAFSDINIAGDLDLANNSIINVSGIFFNDGTYIGDGNSFDISSNQTIKLRGTADNSGIEILTYNRIYQQLGDDNYNGFYGLSKNNYPRISDAYSQKIVSSWDTQNITNNWKSIAWSPDLKIFLVVSTDGSNRIRRSSDGINWSIVTSVSNSWQSVCYSNKLKLFAGISNQETDGLFFYNGVDVSYVTVNRQSNNNLNRTCIIWVEELEMFVITCRSNITNRTNRIILIKKPYTSATPINPGNVINSNNWTSITWSPELKLLVAVADSDNNNINNNRVMTSKDGENWTSINPNSNNEWSSITWASDLGLFVAVAKGGDSNRVMLSRNGSNWTLIDPNSNNAWISVIWSNELKLLIAIANSGINDNRIMTSKDGYNWNLINPNSNNPWNNITWSPELGLFVAVGTDRFLNSSLRNRTPTNYNIFDNSFNNIDNSGNWVIKAKEIYGSNILLNGNVEISGNFAFNINSINNNLEISGNLLVKNDASFNNNVEISGNLIVNSDVEILGNLIVNSDTSFNNNVEISGNLLVKNDASFNNNVEISGNLIVNSDTSFNNNVEISGNLIVNSDVEISGNLIVNSDTSFNNNVEISGNLIVNSDVEILGNLVVNSDTSFNNNVEISGNLIVNSDVEILGNLVVNSDASFNSNVDISGDLNVLSRLDVLGDASFNSNVDISGTLIVDTTTYPSDFRLKTNIEDIDNGLEKVNSLRGVSYNFINRPDKRRLGFIAQEVEEILPELVINRNDYKLLNYVEIIPVLVEAIKELKKENENLKSNMKLILDRLDKINPS
jgi:predicted acyltransferase (DUF342 family)